MKYLSVIILTLAFSCGPHTKIEYHLDTPMPKLQQMNDGYEAWGFTTTYDMGYVVYCDIYLAPMSVYKTQSCFQAIVDHELKHCYGLKHDAHDSSFFPNECINPWKEYHNGS